MAELEISNLKGQTVHKTPGSIDGESFAIKNLEDCCVYVLDYTSEVEVSNCKSCQIFIGPVDGPAIFKDCTECQVAVACQQFQAHKCHNVEFGLYSATQPSISECTEIRFGCWMGAYPNLTSHFHAANLDPKQNSWDKVFDNSHEADGPANFELVDSVQYWEVPLEGAGAPENPVPAADGSMYRGPATENGASGTGEFGAFDGPQPPMQNGKVGPVATPQGEDQEHPKVTAMMERMRERLGEQERTEQTTRTQLSQQAASFLETFYERRNTRRESRAKHNRENEKEVAVKGPEGDTEWERAINLINFGFTRPSGTDLSRFKTVLFNAKAKNMPVAAR